MLEFHVTMVVIIFQKSHIVVHVTIYTSFPFMDSQICNSSLDLKIYYDFKYIQNTYRCRSSSIIMQLFDISQGIHSYWFRSEVIANTTSRSRIIILLLWHPGVLLRLHIYVIFTTICMHVYIQTNHFFYFLSLPISAESIMLSKF